MITNICQNTYKMGEKYHYEIDGIIVTHNAIYPRKRKNPNTPLHLKWFIRQKAEAKV